MTARDRAAMILGWDKLQEMERAGLIVTEARYAELVIVARRIYGEGEAAGLESASMIFEKQIKEGA